MKSKDTTNNKKSFGNIIDNIFNILKNDDTQSAEALKHSKSYSLLLKTYVQTTETSAKIKNILKCLFFYNHNGYYGCRCIFLLLYIKVCHFFF